MSSTSSRPSYSTGTPPPPSPRYKYVPPWVDPKWEDEGPIREASDWKIRSGLVDQVRPAVLPKDQAKNPTPYAQRFGIFPGRTDGRSRTSPTRASSRPLFNAGNIWTSADLIAHFNALATQRGQTLDEFMTTERPELQDLSDADRVYVMAYQDLLLDEQWQAAILGQITSQELLEENCFTLAGATTNLNGPLHPFVARDRWLDADKYYVLAPTTRPEYVLDNKVKEYDPLCNDEVWNALQPALQLATRLLNADEPFFHALADVTRRVIIDAVRDPRPNRLDKPRFKFGLQKPDRDPNWSQTARDLASVPGFSPSATSFEILRNMLRFKIGTCHEDVRETFSLRNPVGGATQTIVEADDVDITITISGELIWPLLVKQFSRSEKMMASHAIAVTIVHETMHALEYAHQRWLYDPRNNGVNDPRAINLAFQFYKEIAHKNPLRPPDYEPHFEDDTYSELGHAYESHVLGGGVWPSGSSRTGAGPMLLSDSPCILTRSKWPDGRGQGEEPDELKHPRSRLDMMFSFVRIDKIQRGFREEFWKTIVPKYGMAAMRDPGPKPDLVFYNSDASEKTLPDFEGLNLGTRNDRDWIVNYLEDMQEEGQVTLATYMTSLVLDSCRFSSMMCRFDNNEEPEHAARGKTTQAILILLSSIYELRGWLITQLPLNDPSRRSLLIGQYQMWQRLREKGAALDDQSIFADAPDANFQTFILRLRGVQQGGHRLSDRVVTHLMSLAHLVDEDLKRQENSVCELYQLPTRFWSLYNAQRPEHRPKWLTWCRRIVFLTTKITALLDGFSSALPFWNNEWKGRVASWITNFSNIVKLIDTEDNSVHSNWRELLVTVPMMRKSRRSAREQMFFLARREMMTLTGEDLAMMEEFATRFEKMMNLDLHKVVLPTSKDDQIAYTEIWAGILDDQTQAFVQGQNLYQIFNTPEMKARVAGLEKERKDFEDDLYNRAVEQGVFEVVQKIMPPNFSNLPPQVTQPVVSNHPQPLTSLQQGAPLPVQPGQPWIGNQPQPVGNLPQGPPFVGHPQPQGNLQQGPQFPVQPGQQWIGNQPQPMGNQPGSSFFAQPSQPSPWNQPQPMGNLQQVAPPAVQQSQPGMGIPGLPGGGLVPHAYTINQNATHSLQGASHNIFSNPPVNWQQQQQQQQQATQAAYQNLQNIAAAATSALATAAPQPQAGPNAPAQDDSDDSGSILLARHIEGPGSTSESDSGIDSCKQSRASSYATTVESDNDSGVGRDSGIARAKGLKRKAFASGHVALEEKRHSKKQRKA